MQARGSDRRTGEQSSAEWTTPTGALGALCASSQARALLGAAALPELRKRAADAPPPPRFAAALRQETLAVIAEIKRSSPTKGAIAPALDAVAQARAYERGGAAAISVLTEPDRFGGSLADLSAVAEAVSIPVLRKDFILHPVQLWEARVRGAAAVLLIARALSPSQLADLYAEALGAGLEVLLEVRSREELTLALLIGATVIGINNRNLETLVIDAATAPSLLSSVPQAVIGIAESGMAHVADAEAARMAGADGLLIGSSISAASDPAAAVSAFARLPRVETPARRAAGSASAA